MLVKWAPRSIEKVSETSYFIPCLSSSALQRSFVRFVVYSLLVVSRFRHTPKLSKTHWFGWITRTHTRVLYCHFPLLWCHQRTVKIWNEFRMTKEDGVVRLADRNEVEVTKHARKQWIGQIIIIIIYLFIKHIHIDGRKQDTVFYRFLRGFYLHYCYYTCTAHSWSGTTVRHYSASSWHPTWMKTKSGTGQQCTHSTLIVGLHKACNYCQTFTIK